MKPEKLYNLLGLVAPKPKLENHIDFIISLNYRELFKLVRESIEQDSRFHCINLSELSLTKFPNKEHGIIKTYFFNFDNIERVRGLTIRNLYIDNTYTKNEIERIKLYFGPAAKNIIIIGSQE